jgi:hypothetical protein
LRQTGTCHGEAGAKNLADNLSKKKILNGFDRARSTDRERPMEQVNMGSELFMALDLLKRDGLKVKRDGSKGVIPRRYRHDAEGFAWVLIYICGITCEQEGKTATVASDPFRRWFDGSWERCLHHKAAFTIAGLRLPLQEHAGPLMLGLYDFWDRRHHPSQKSKIRQEEKAVDPEFVVDGIEDGGSSDRQMFAKLAAVFGERLGANTPERSYAVELVEKVRKSGVTSA